MPTILAGALPPSLGILALAAVFSAEVSSADAVLFMLATSASRDLYRGFIRPSATEAEVLRVARLAALAGGIGGVGVALVYGSVRAAVSVFYSILIVTLFVPIVGGLYMRRAGGREGLASILLGVPVLGDHALSDRRTGIRRPLPRARRRARERRRVLRRARNGNSRQGSLNDQTGDGRWGRRLSTKQISSLSPLLLFDLGAK